jgi:hypothetical protein
MAEDATPLVEALVAIIEAARAYLPPDGIGKDAFITRAIEATGNPRIIAALATLVIKWRGQRKMQLVDRV